MCEWEIDFLAPYTHLRQLSGACILIPRIFHALESWKPDVRVRPWWKLKTRRNHQNPFLLWLKQKLQLIFSFFLQTPLLSGKPTWFISILYFCPLILLVNPQLSLLYITFFFSNTQFNIFSNYRVGSKMAHSPNYKPKIITGPTGYVLEDVPHLSDYVPDLPVRRRSFSSPLVFLLRPIKSCFYL